MPNCSCHGAFIGRENCVVQLVVWSYVVVLRLPETSASRLLSASAVARLLRLFFLLVIAFARISILHVSVEIPRRRRRPFLLCRGRCVILALSPVGWCTFLSLGRGRRLSRPSAPQRLTARGFPVTHAGCIKFVLRLTSTDGQKVILAKVLDPHLSTRMSSDSRRHEPADAHVAPIHIVFLITDVILHAEQRTPQLLSLSFALTGGSTSQSFLTRLCIVFTSSDASRWVCNDSAAMGGRSRRVAREWRGIRRSEGKGSGWCQVWKWDREIHVGELSVAPKVPGTTANSLVCGADASAFQSSQISWASTCLRILSFPHFLSFTARTGHSRLVDFVEGGPTGSGANSRGNQPVEPVRNLDPQTFVLDSLSWNHERACPTFERCGDRQQQ